MDDEPSSQPFVHNPNIFYSSSQEPRVHYRTTRGQITEIERDAKIAKFEEDLLKIQQALLENDIRLKKNKKDLRIYYFVGRLNPPHNGHIETLRRLIQSAIDQNLDNPNYKVIILLGKVLKLLD